MRTDVVILGDELEGLVAAVRLLERGKSVRLISRGGGSHHYAPDGLRLLGYGPDGGDEPIRNPYEAIERMSEHHPLRLLGRGRVRAALDWFLEWALQQGIQYRSNGCNALTLSAAGLPVPVFATTAHQATWDDAAAGTIAVMCFEGHKDFAAGLTVSELRRRNIDAHLVRLEAPCGSPDSMQLARFFDRSRDLDGYVRSFRDHLPPKSTHAFFPAVLGLDRHDETMKSIERGLRVPCREVPTLPPSIPGLRLSRHLTKHIETKGGFIHLGVRAHGPAGNNGRCEAIWDDAGRRFEAETFILATGGVLMGGLEVESNGRVRETIFDLDVAQTRPLEAKHPDLALDALHETGVATDARLRALSKSHVVYDNLFVVGRTLSHGNVTKEASVEGVAIATGWAAAEEACAYMEG